MPQQRGNSRTTTAMDRLLEVLVNEQLAVAKATLAVAMKEQGFTTTLKSLNRGCWPTGEMKTVVGGVVEEFPSGLCDAALDTDQGRVILRNAQRTDHLPDPQFVETKTNSGIESADGLLRQLIESHPDLPPKLLYKIELTRFDAAQQKALLPLLWQYILAHRDSNNRDEIVATGAAIRKYIAIIPMDNMGELAVLLESGHRAPLPIDLELEVIKMIYRNFEVHPPVANDSHPALAQRLGEIVEAYVNPRIILRDKHSAVASLAIEALFAMRSSLAGKAWKIAVLCPHRWFAELVSDNLDYLHEKWTRTNPEAAAWLDNLRERALAIC